jgi:K+-sensing histidine kinase KdpD
MRDLNETDKLYHAIRGMMYSIRFSLNKLTVLDRDRSNELAHDIHDILINYSKSQSEIKKNYLSNPVEDLISEVDIGKTIIEITSYLRKQNKRPLYFKTNLEAGLTLLTCRVTLHRTLMRIIEYAAYSTVSAKNSLIEIESKHSSEGIEINIMDQGQRLPAGFVTEINRQNFTKLSKANSYLFGPASTMSLIESLSGSLRIIEATKNGNKAQLKFPYFIANKMLESTTVEMLPTPPTIKRRGPPAIYL